MKSIATISGTPSAAMMKSGHVPGSLDRLQHLGDTNGGGEAELPGDHCPHRANRQPE
jgi:hypothetical protein